MWIGSLGQGQKWKDVSAERSLYQTYTNITGRPIIVALWGYGAYECFDLGLAVNGVVADYFRMTQECNNVGDGHATVSGVVPPGSSYQFITSGNVRAIIYLKFRELS